VKSTQSIHVGKGLYAYCMAVAVMVLSVILFWYSMEQSRAALESRRRSMVFAGGMEELLLLVKDAEASQRGYLLTRDRVYLEPYGGIWDGIWDTMASVAAIEGASRRQQDRLDALQETLRARQAEMDGTIDLARAGKWEKAGDVVRTHQGLSLTERLKATIRAARAEEERVQFDKDLGLQRHNRMMLSFVIGGYALVAVLAFLSILLMQREAESRMAAVREVNAERQRFFGQT
jgi:CHASE3 domain sensor protein